MPSSLSVAVFFVTETRIGSSSEEVADDPIEATARRDRLLLLLLLLLLLRGLPLPVGATHPVVEGATNASDPCSSGSNRVVDQTTRNVVE
jgi:hypothetical protein